MPHAQTLAPRAPDELPLKPCGMCDRMIPWPLASHGKPIQPHIYARRKFCSVQCAAEASRGPRGKVKARWAAALRRAEEREQGRMRLGPQVVSFPYGHTCAVCGETVRKGHPIHRAQPREDVTIVRLTPA